MSSRMAQPTLSKFFSKEAGSMPSGPSTRGREAKSLLQALRDECSVDSDVTSEGSRECAFSPLDIVWATYSNYPAWPAIVCKDVDTDRYFHKDLLHVQFFDVPPSLAWVHLKGTRLLKSTDNVENKPQWKKMLTRAFTEAKVALRSSKLQRAELIKQREEQESDDDDDSSFNESTDEDSDWSEKASVKKKPNQAKKPKKDMEHDEDLSEYEKLRLKNIKEREALFNKLKIGQCKDQLNQHFKKPNPPKRGLSSGHSSGNKAPVLPARRSRRILLLEGDVEAGKENSPVDDAQEKDEESPRLPLTALTMEDVIVAASSDVAAAAEEEVRFLKSFCDQLQTSEATKTPSSQEVASFNNPSASSEALELKESGIAKVVPNRIASMAVHSSHSKVLLAAGSKSGYVGLWDVQDVNSESHGVHLLKPHSGGVNAMDFDKYNPFKLITSSHDGTIRCLDMEKGRVDLLFGQPGEEEPDSVAYHVQLDASSFLAAVGVKGRVYLIDTRVSNVKPASNYQIFGRESIKTLDVHPLNRSQLLCSTSRGGCAVFDLRSWSTPGHGKEPVMIFGGHTRSLSSAFYSPLTGRSVCTVSFDDRIRLFSAEEGSSAERTPLASFSHNNQTGRWLSTFKASWHPLREDLFAVGSLRQPRQIELYSDTGELYPPLKGAYLNSVCSIVKFHPSREVLVGGNSSGKVHLFAGDL